MRYLLWLLPLLLSADVGTLSTVIDGDTLHLRSGGKTIKCRIAWIDTPEYQENDRARSYARQCKGVELDQILQAGRKARAYAQSHFRPGQQIHYEVVDEDRHGRKVCLMEYSLQSVKDGYAIPYWKHIPQQKKEEFKKALRQGRGGGLWKSHQAVMECMERK